MKTRLIALPFVSLLALGSTAWADIGDECQLDADCGAGLVCQVVGGTGCACPDGAACEPCETTEFRACVPGPCTQDGDCGDGLVCVSYETPCATTEPACPPDSNCDLPAPPPCETTTTSVCAPKWILPCQADADCGDGFTCEAGETCACSGGGASTPPSDASGGSSGSSDPADPSGAPLPPPEDDCTCTPSDTKTCHPKELTCTADDECPAGWSCAAAPSTQTCSASSDGGEPQCDPPTDPGPGSCYPAGWYGGSATDGNTKGGVDTDLGLPEQATAEHTGAPTDPTDPTDPTGGTNAAGGGCDAGGAGSMTLAMAGLALAFARRRRTA
ncbi:MAG: MYXO-CTERM sorting domain-containing protein [Myxococcota bacterium]